MRFSHAPLTLLSLLIIIVTSIHPTSAKPYPREDPALVSSNVIEERTCAIPCGWNGLCCAQGQTCTTDTAGQPLCGGGAQAAVSQAAAVTTAAVQTAAGGQWQYFTTTWVETGLITRTSIYSSYVGATAQQAPATTYQVQTTAAPIAGAATCNYALNETPCGSICCTGQQHCMSPGQCAAGAGGSSNNNYNSQSYSAAIRPTSSGVLTVTSTATTTGPFQTPIPTGTAGSSLTGASAQSNNGLSGGAIAGIVIGVIAGIILLLLLCAAYCFRAGLDGLLALFGLGPKRRRHEETYVEERYSHHGHGGSGGRNWYGSRPSRVQRPPQKSSGVGGFGAVGAGLAALAVILGLKRRSHRNEKSSYGSESSYSSYDYTSSSSASSDDRRTRNTRHSRH